MHTKRHLVLTALFAAIFWGGSFPIVKFGLHYLKPLWFADLRMSIAFLFMFIFVKNKKAFWKFPKEIWWLGIFNAAGYFLQFVGMEYTTAAKASFFVNINVVFVVILAHFLFQEKLQWEKYLAVFLSLLGIYFLVSKGQGIQIFKEGSALGDALVLLAGISWAFFIIINKKVLAYPAFSVFDIVTAFVFTTVVFMTPVAVLFEPFPVHASAMGIGILLTTGIVFTLIPFYFWSVSLKGLTATLTSFLTLSEILFAVAFSFIFLGETLQPIEIGGGVLLLIAIFAASVR